MERAAQGELWEGQGTGLTAWCGGWLWGCAWEPGNRGEKPEEALLRLQAGGGPAPWVPFQAFTLPSPFISQ